jgi:hypothetical protein
MFLPAASAQKTNRPAAAAASARPRAAAQARPQIARTQPAWRQAMQRLPRPAPGCYTSAFPRVEWRTVPCGPAPDYPIIPRTGGATHFVVGNGTNDFVAQPANPISAAEGTFVAVSAGITESGPIGNSGPSIANAYTLQINTDQFVSGACAGSPNAGCRGWQQFVYENNNFDRRVFIQYWLIKYNAPCPSAAWTQFSFTNNPDIYCYQSTLTASLPAGQPVSNLGAMTLAGAVSAASDQVTITAGANMATRVGLNAVAASGAWGQAEFNIFGDGGNANGGGQAAFGANTTLTVRTTVHSGTTAAPNCLFDSFTGETNNLTLVGMAPIGIQPSPAIEFTQSNIPGTPAACVTAAGVGDTHLSTFGGLLYDFQASGDFVLARTGQDFMVQARQVSGAPNWPNASINTAVAAQMGRTRIAICSPNAERLNVDGEGKSIRDGERVSLPGGIDIQRLGNVYVVIDRHGNSMRAALNGTYINVSVGLARWPTAVTGILANAGGNPSQIATRDGTVLTTPFAFAELYQRYADSWRPARGESLLNVCGAARENAAPRQTLTTRDLDPRLARRARTVCTAAGVTDGALLEACTLDVVVLGRDDAARVFTTLRRPVAVGVICEATEPAYGAAPARNNRRPRCPPPPGPNRRY